MMKTDQWEINTNKASRSIWSTGVDSQFTISNPKFKQLLHRYISDQMLYHWKFWIPFPFVRERKLIRVGRGERLLLGSSGVVGSSMDFAFRLQFESRLSPYKPCDNFLKLQLSGPVGGYHSLPFTARSGWNDNTRESISTVPGTQ